MNEILLFVEIIVTFGLLLLFKKFLGKTGVFAWVAIASVIANIQVLKSVDIFGISATLGNVMFASNFLATDIISECYGKKEAEKCVYVGLFSVIAFLIISQISLLFTPNEIDVAQSSMQTLFSLAPRTCLASVAMFFIANLVHVKIYNLLKDKFNNRKLWVRNNVSTILCNCLENFGFVLLAFYGIYPMKELLGIAISTCVIEILISLCDTPFLYLARRKNV